MKPMRVVSVIAIMGLLAGEASAAPFERNGQMVWQPTLMEVAISSCAGGAAVGALVAWGGGAMAPAPTAALFCGLSVTATVAANVASRTWRSTADWLWR